MNFLLLKTIKSELETLFQNALFREPLDTESLIIPRILIGDLPPKRKSPDQGKDFPFVVLRTTSGKDDSDGSTTDVLFICGDYTAGDESDGAEEVQNMVDRIRRWLLSIEGLDSRYRVVLPITWKMGGNDQGDQDPPYNFGRVTCTWQVPAAIPVPTPDEQVEVFGAGYNE